MSNDALIAQIRARLSSLNTTDLMDVYDTISRCGIRAARQGREAISNGQTVTTTQLALLAGVTPQYVRRMVSAGEVAASGSTVTAKAARQWLSGRGVPGF